MNDDDFVAAFEARTLANDQFHHVDHVRLAFLYLRRFPAMEAIRRFSEGLRNFAAHHGKPERYHETITWAFLLLVRERLARVSAGDPTWEEFSASNPDLLDWKCNVLKRYYFEETLSSDLARSIFVFPDRIAG